MLLITAETYSKYLDPNDKSVRTIFGDGAAATFVVAQNNTKDYAIGLPEYGTDGSGGKHLIVKSGLKHKNEESNKYLMMNGPEIFTFTLRVVPKVI